MFCDWRASPKTCIERPKSFRSCPSNVEISYRRLELLIDGRHLLLLPSMFLSLQPTYLLLLLQVSTSMAATPPSTSDDLQAALEKLLNGPASPPPAGITPNLDNPPNQQVSLSIVATLTLSFSTCAVIIRIYTKRFVLRTMGYEDCRWRYSLRCG